MNPQHLKIATQATLGLSALATLGALAYEVELLSIAIWVLIPYAVLLACCVSARTFRGALATFVVTLLASGFALAMYADALFANYSEFSGLVFIFTPLYQLIAALILLAALNIHRLAAFGKRPLPTMGAGARDNSSDTPSQKRPQPRLGIGHVMLYTACVAVALGARQEWWGFADASIIGPGMAVLIRVSWIIRSLLDGIPMAAVLVMFGRWWRRQPFPVQPGEWILVSYGARAWLACVIGPVFQVLGPGLGAFMLVGSILPILLFVGAYRARHSKAWSVHLFASAVIATVMAVGPAISSIPLPDVGIGVGMLLVGLGGALIVCFLLAAIIMFIVAVVGDLRRAQCRGWMHWLGVWYAIAIVVATVLTRAIRP